MLDRVVRTCHPSYVGSTNRRIKFQADPGIKVRPYLQNNQCKEGWDVVQVAEHLPSKCKALR
jgi:hypothetical protein